LKQVNVVAENNNPEMRDLGTHQAGDVNLHETINWSKPISIKPAQAPGAVPEKENEDE